MILYAEERFLNEFTFGFELEGWADSENDKYEFESWAAEYFEEIAEDKKNVHIDISSIVMKDDSSIQPDDDGYRDTCDSCGGDGYYSCEDCGGSGEVSFECGICQGNGYVIADCEYCNDDGKVKCKKCNGTGEDPEGQLMLDGKVEPCHKCDGEEWVDCPICDGEEWVDCPICDGEGKIRERCSTCDGEGRVGCEDCGGRGYFTDGDDPRTFEWASPIMNINYKNLSTVINFLHQCMKNKNINTNNSCGFHIHIGFPDKLNSHIDRLWILINLAINKEMFESILKYKGMEFFNRTYAPIHEIQRIESLIYKNNSDNLNKELAEAVSSAKYNVLRQHPQGTLEWRGPRSFLNGGRIENIKGFFLKVFYPFVKWITKIVDEESITVNTDKGEIVLNKNEINKYITTQAKNSVGVRNIASGKFDSSQNMDVVRKLAVHNKDIIKLKFKNMVIEEVGNNNFKFFNGEMQNNNEIINEKLFFRNCSFINNKHIDVASISNCSCSNSEMIKIHHSDDSLISSINLSINESINDLIRDCDNVYIKECSRGTFRYIERLNIERAYNLSISDCKNININYIDNTTIRNSSIYGGKYESCKIDITNKMLGGYYDNCEIILYSSYDNKLFDHGTFHNCIYIIDIGRNSYSSKYIKFRANMSPKKFVENFNELFEQYVKYNFPETQYTPYNGKTIEDIRIYLKNFYNN
ncbi:MAG: putative amidoligase enzyme [candidate division CPR1 bacterium ADurb.Bin160]|uniref:Putative amidoligase enzyme n=1 Tax=candidate division CPR1 bacterium ADurb.Bin160 TaxID=1852826 RepID=A0A1V5ZJU9_9BACT|nr:MAG: putative amidoligase enzyme [candidate division CPR1 bacterium ADurb.Bin160]